VRRRLRVWTLISGIAVLAAACAGAGTADLKLNELQRVKSGQIEVVLLSPRDAIRHGQDSFVIEFRSSAGALVDVGDVKGSVTMPMPGTPMFGSLDITRTAVTGRYDAGIKADMAGTWRMALQWSGLAGPGSVTFAGNLQ
jgi:YtkA-like protein